MDNEIKHPGTKSVGWALVQAARLHRSRTGDKLSDLGLFAGQEQVLQALGNSGPMTMGDLAHDPAGAPADRLEDDLAPVRPQAGRAPYRARRRPRSCA